MKDITSKEKYDEQQMLYQQIMMYSTDGIITINMDGIVTTWNHAAEEMFTYTADEALGNNLFDLLVVENIKEKTAIIKKIKHSAYDNHFEINRIKKSGEGIVVSCTISPVMNTEYEIVGKSVVARDITALRRLENELKHLNNEFEMRIKERTEEIESFSYSVSHDLRAPLRAVNGYAKIIEEDFQTVLNEEGIRLLREVQSNALKMGELIDALLDFSKLGRQPVTKSVIDMNTLVESVVNEISTSTPHHAKIKCHDILPACADNSLMKHVFTNLISNAIKYSSQNDFSQIDITSVRNHSEVIYKIKDNGVGFDMEYAGKLFGVFQRLHSNEQFPGTGVGLAIVHRIIQKHNGKVWAKGKENEGAEFYFSLPL
jgi:PAS domain S-box-containing protein